MQLCPCTHASVLRSVTVPYHLFLHVSALATASLRTQYLTAFQCLYKSLELAKKVSSGRWDELEQMVQ